MSERAETGRGGIALWETEGQPTAFWPAEAGTLLAFMRERSGQDVRIEVGPWMAPQAAGNPMRMRAYQLIPTAPLDPKPKGQLITPHGIESTAQVGLQESDG